MNNSIKALKVDGGWVDSSMEVRRAVVDYFQWHVAEERCERLTLNGVPFSTLSNEENRDLIATFSLTEIEAVVKGSVGLAKWMDWMDMDLDPNGWIKKGPLIHYNPLLFFS